MAFEAIEECSGDCGSPAHAHLCALTTRACVNLWRAADCLLRRLRRLRCLGWTVGLVCSVGLWGGGASDPVVCTACGGSGKVVMADEGNGRVVSAVGDGWVGVCGEVTAGVADSGGECRGW